MINNWTDYWKRFDQLIISLSETNQISCIEELKEAQLHVNGLTDGWFEFLEGFEKSIDKFRNQLSKDQIHQANILISTLRNILTNR